MILRRQRAYFWAPFGLEFVELLQRGVDSLRSVLLDSPSGQFSMFQSDKFHFLSNSSHLKVNQLGNTTWAMEGGKEDYLKLEALL